MIFPVKFGKIIRCCKQIVELNTEGRTREREGEKGSERGRERKGLRVREGGRKGVGRREGERGWRKGRE